ncbi:TetR/AcrR family transcriptional regulator [Amycolatopsis taiwanensis]|uniref:TetR family transcriptional regulator n=1 Tax=Amycolatopsis taiwanensis TaxID=342230 RepID=A0A9W6R8P2_9PSEU|nr:TetR family transcriptional regulator [Amycolatopsis taiwanensis]GLY70320.1 TetR family transcriptional regulator [Amycolatopsis taiwanensis]
MATQQNAGSRRARRNDPDRRSRIAHAAIEVVAKHGIDGLTHRAVAAIAGVPLGSMTYHFTTLDDLLEVALQQAADDNVSHLREWERSLAPDADFAAALAELVMRYVQEEHPHTVVEYDLYVAALHRPRLRAASSAWDGALISLFSSRTDELTGRLLAGLFCGLLLQAAVAYPPPSYEEVEDLFRRAIDGPPQKSRPRHVR